MIKQSQKYIIDEFNTNNLRLMGIHGDVLVNWNKNIQIFII